MERLLLFGAGLVTGVLGGFLVNRGVNHFGGDNGVKWPVLPDVPVLHTRPKKRLRPQLERNEIDNGVIQSPESA